jgi:hypothetical protein
MIAVRDDLSLLNNLSATAQSSQDVPRGADRRFTGDGARIGLHPLSLEEIVQ